MYFEKRWLSETLARKPLLSVSVCRNEDEGYILRNEFKRLRYKSNTVTGSSTINFDEVHIREN